MSTASRFRVIGMDCVKDAAEIEGVVRGVPGVLAARVSTATQLLTVQATAGEGGDSHLEGALERAVAELGYHLERAEAASRTGTVGSAAPAGHPEPGPTHMAAGYRRALWSVVLLNAGYGIVEMAGGFLSGSQALKADALDFLGDGLITLLGLVAIGWGLRWRARSALIQGLFLGALGLGVLGSTVQRVLTQQPPEADLMGGFGLVALAVNVVAAVLLIPHRTGDANARAVWLFSRNDAIGNMAVVIAAILVAWLDSAWPDLVVAFIIAALFLQSSWVIVRDAREDLQWSPESPSPQDLT